MYRLTIGSRTGLSIMCLAQRAMILERAGERSMQSSMIWVKVPGVGDIPLQVGIEHVPDGSPDQWRVSQHVL